MAGLKEKYINEKNKKKTSKIKKAGSKIVKKIKRKIYFAKHRDKVVDKNYDKKTGIYTVTLKSRGKLYKGSYTKGSDRYGKDATSMYGESKSSMKRYAKVDAIKKSLTDPNRPDIPKEYRWLD